MRPEIDRLLKQADRDVENARKHLTIQAYEVAAFLAQQAVEKYLKGTWVVVRKEPAPHTHALTELGDGLGVPPDLRRHLADLTSDYTRAGRGPERGDGDRVAQAEDRKLAAFVRDHLPTLRERLAPLRVIAFGSRVRGDALSTSDLDLVLVPPWFGSVPFVRRAATILELLDYPGGLELLCYTPEEFDERRQELGIVWLGPAPQAHRARARRSGASVHRGLRVHEGEPRARAGAEHLARRPRRSHA